jgi:hypothetical protein
MHSVAAREPVERINLFVVTDSFVSECRSHQPETNQSVTASDSFEGYVRGGAMKLRVVLVIVFFLVPQARSIASSSHQPQSQTEPTASISGKVTLRGTPVSGVLIQVRSDPPIGNNQATGKTDANGQYRITNIPAGSYTVVATAIALTEERDRYGTRITLDRGEARENVDFSLIRGGVITGRVSDANGRPFIEEGISVRAATAGRPQPYYQPVYLQTMITDDRGVYRIYGLPPGRYKISVGEGGGSAYRRMNQGPNYFPHTYHPGVTEESKAGIIDLSEGGEVSGVDIVVGARAKTFEALVRIVDAETGKPQPGINMDINGNAMSTFGKQSDENGEFKITGLIPGHYSVFAGCEGDYFSDKVEFDVTDHNVTGLEIRRNRGASISGKVVVDGVTDPTVLSKLKEMFIFAGEVGATIDPDGSYNFCGLRPGRVQVTARSIRSVGFWLMRVERDGADLREGIDLAPGDHVTDVRVVLGYATGAIRGQVTLVGDALPQGMRFQILANRIGEEERSNNLFANADERGRFVIEGLISGEYELTAGSNFSSVVPGAPIPRLERVTQRVTVTNGAESAVTLVLKPIEKHKPQ